MTEDLKEVLKTHSFNDLPIVFEENERNGEWTRTVKRTGTISELLEVWDIDDPEDDDSMAQVLRYLRTALESYKCPKT